MIAVLANAFRFQFDGWVCIGIVIVLAATAASTRRTSRRCPRCQEINRNAAQYCAQCGQRLSRS